MNRLCHAPFPGGDGPKAPVGQERRDGQADVGAHDDGIGGAV